MSRQDDRFDTLLLDDEPEQGTIDRAPRPPVQRQSTTAPAAAAVRLHGFDLLDQPLLSHLPGLPGEIVPAQTTVSLRSSQIGSTVVVLFDQGDVRRPIVVGVVIDLTNRIAEADAADSVTVQADDNRLVLSAEREIILKCGAASITLTRAGKVLIQGEYVSTRAAGVNRIKGGSVQIN